MSVNRDMDKYLRLFIYSGGIFICFLYYSILQERITKRVYYYGTSREGQEMFTCYLTLVFIQCVVSYIYANLLLRTVMKEQSENRTKTLYYWTSALTNLLSTVCSSMALHWISYPAQIIGKSGKPIPVMMLGVLLGKKVYPCYKFVFVFILVFGVALFMWNGNEETNFFEKYSQEVGGRGDNHIGELLICLSLMMDGITAAIQERMRTEYMTKSLHMMSSLNKWSVVFLGVALPCTGEILTFLEFVNRHPDVLWETISFSMVNTQGQLFIFLMIEHFGPLPCSLVTTLRKFFTVFASVFIFGNTLFVRQWIATVYYIFTGLLLDIVWKDFYNHIIVERCCRLIQAKRTRSREIGYRDQWV